MAIDKFLVEASHIMMFARSVGDANPIYHDAEYAEGTELGGIIAPPTFAQSSAQFDPNYFLRPKVGGDGWFGSGCLLYTSPSPRDKRQSRMPSSA